MLRIHFTGEDLGQVRIAGEADACWEAWLSLRLLRARAGPSLFEPWRRRVLAQRVSDRSLAAALRVLAAVSDAPEPVVSGPYEQALSDYYDAAIAPYHEHVLMRLDADRAVRARAFLDGGVDALLASLRPGAVWRSPVLELAARAGEVRLGGRGVRLIPSYFCLAPILVPGNGCGPALLYPVDRTVPCCAAGTARQASSSLAALLGRTRALVLRMLESGASTSELAQRLNIAPASASEHTRVLREAGLVTSHRVSRAVLHTLTPLGRSLLDGGCQPPYAVQGVFTTKTFAGSAGGLS
ncbi:ArsR/SmtB family transcription factor [Amycolatopsis samaneae]|uniref:ArsR/SmtB family transcription factor n=1 Tax=Amycolatopsis samaneae TaxID=664691 RepID=A0ABW5GTU6_9PSEU